MQSDRLRFYPVAVGADLVRQNMFEFELNTDKATIDGATILRIMCKSFTVQLPTTNNVQVNWMAGVMQLAGRQTTAYSLQTVFYVGSDDDRDGMKALYSWRNKVMDHKEGFIYSASNYKANGFVSIYDITGNYLKYKIGAEGLWPTNIGDISLSVENDGPIELACSFAADRMWIDNYTV